MLVWSNKEDDMKGKVAVCSIRIMQLILEDPDFVLILLYSY